MCSLYEGNKSNPPLPWFVSGPNMLHVRRPFMKLLESNNVNQIFFSNGAQQEGTNPGLIYNSVFWVKWWAASQGNSPTLDPHICFFFTLF